MKYTDFNADKIIKLLNDNGYKAYYVGGCVRDALNDNVPNDFDITTDALPEETVKIFSEAGYAVIETGIKHGTVSVIMAHKPYEVTTFRTEGVYSDNRHPESVAFVRDLKEDLSRRDFTINAMAYNGNDGVIDYFSGREDLQNKIIRCVGEASVRFEEDALRILRALRFASRLGFEIEKNTSKAIREKKHLLKNISAERIFTEFKGLLMGENAAKIIREYYDVIGEFIPELLLLKDCPQNSKWHIYDVFEHTMVALENTEKDIILRLAVFFHDFGKPHVRTVNAEGKDSFKGHQNVSFDMAGKILRRLKADTKTIQSVKILVLHHDDRIPVDVIAAKKMIKTVGRENALRIIKMEIADNAAHNPKLIKDRFYELLQLSDIIKKILSDKSACLEINDLAINGSDIMKLGVKQGPDLGEILKLLRNEVIEEKIQNDRGVLVNYIRNSILKI